jgi:hypothetical protein
MLFTKMQTNKAYQTRSRLVISSKYYRSLNNRLILSCTRWPDMAAAAEVVVGADEAVAAVVAVAVVVVSSAQSLARP